jgi:organic radical activating enzyme
VDNYYGKLIENVRYWHACNSSSSHSVLLLDSHEDLAKIHTDEYYEFGWSYFTVANATARRNYAIGLIEPILRGMVSRDAPWELQAPATQSMLEALVEKLPMHLLPVEDLREISVDHQSNEDITWPTDRYGKISLPFLLEFIEWFAAAPILVLGGNDNDDGMHGLAMVGDEGKRLDLGWTGRATKDPVYGHWVVYNKANGTKLRVRFNQQPASDRSSFPELVDIGIGDYCPFNCAFCYTDSTVEGKWASTTAICDIVRELGQLGTLEVAFGGGEPTLHPELDTILLNCEYSHITPNMTTKNLTWLSDSKSMALIKRFGAIAFSVQTAKEVQALVSVIKKVRAAGGTTQFTAQVVVGAIPEQDFREVLQAAKKHSVRLTLLGYKMVGRGPVATKYEYDWYVLAKEADLKALAIDTVLAKELPDAVPKTWYHTQEGAWSCYINALTKEMGPSSYCAPDKMVPVYGPPTLGGYRSTIIGKQFLALTPE